MSRPLADLEQARRRLMSGAVDVLVLGESSCLSWAQHDSDPTPLPGLLGRHLGADVVTLAGPGHGARLHREFVRILGTLDARPRAVVLSLNVRTEAATHVVQHPWYSHVGTLGELARIESAAGHIRSIGRGTGEGRRLYAAFRALPVETRWSGPTTIGAFREALEGQGPPPWPETIERARFDFFHGELVRPGNRALSHLADLGRRLEEYGVPVVPFWAKPPLPRGEQHFPGEFEEHLRQNLAVATSALRSLTDALPPPVDVPLEAADYQDGRNGAEHYSLSGRLKIVDAIAQHIGALHAPGVS